MRRVSTAVTIAGLIAAAAGLAACNKTPTARSVGPQNEAPLVGGAHALPPAAALAEVSAYKDIASVRVIELPPAGQLPTWLQA